MPASVLLALLAITALVALTPALVRRHDKEERLLRERLDHPVRVLDRESPLETRLSTMPEHPLSAPVTAPPQGLGDAEDSDGEPVAPRSRLWSRRGRRAAESVRLKKLRSSDDEGSEMTDWEIADARRLWWQGRHRRILYILLGLTVLQLAGVVLLGPGFWSGLALSAVCLVAYLRFLRMRALRLGRERRVADRRAAREVPVDELLEEEDGGDGVYVPEQSRFEVEEPDEADFDDESAGDVPEERESYLFGDGSIAFQEEVGSDDVEPLEDDRRDSGGGIRGRSYDAPARLDR
ncbi:hypothetical protein [Salininema proteolyticum]|uniref:Transmembrane protein n=1 Tax=Salininema proteolyticum TaxID=1607685 RepID=A0ABV8TSM6_9ACTN